MGTPGWTVLQGMWEDRERALTDELIGSRSPEDFPVRAAHIKGLREALEAPRALAEVAQRKRQEAEAAHV